METITTDRVFEDTQSYFNIFNKEWLEKNCDNTFFNQGFFVGSFINDKFTVDMSFFPDGDINYIFITTTENKEVGRSQHQLSFIDNLLLFELTKDEIIQLISKVSKYSINKIDEQQCHYGNVKLTFSGNKLIGIYLLNKEL